MLKSSAERYLKEKCPPSLVKALIEDERGFSIDMWREMSQLGWLGLIYNEKYGGSEGSFFDLFILFEEMGKALLPSPFFCSAVLSGLLINESGNEKQKEAYLPSIIEGKKIYTLSLFNEQGSYDGENPALMARKDQSDAFLLNGTGILVPYAHIADGIFICADVKGAGGGGPTIFEVDKNASGMKLTFLNTITREKTYAVAFENVELTPEKLIGDLGKGHDYLKNVLPKAVILKCGEMLGGMQRVLDMTIRHVKERHQFGRPLGALQIVQHHCADISTYVASSRLVAYQAASLMNEGIPCGKEIAMAKAWCSEAYKKSTWIAHQVHGGIGFTEEHDLHLYYKHAKASELAFESPWFHRSIVAEKMGI